jgi:hypothetical protein
MNFLLLAIAISTPTTADTACNDTEFGAMISAPIAQASAFKQELDRRSALVLAEERAVQGGITPAPPPSLVGQFGAPFGLAFAGLVLVMIGAGKKARALALAGGLAIAAGGGLAIRSVAQQHAKLVRVSELRECRFKLLDTRSTLEHGGLAKCYNDLGEADEDLMGWSSRLKAGGAAPTYEMIEHLRKEIAHK